MQHKGVGIGAKLGDDERHPLRHQPGNEGDVAGQAIELRDRDSRTATFGLFESGF